MDIGPYRIIRQLGRGGQGTVYLGQDESGELAAVKVMNVGIDHVFARELAAARQVDEFCTARVLRADLDHDPPYVASEFIDGPALATVAPIRGPALTRLAIGTATALAAIHRAGVVHRDFKPGNVLMGPDGPRVIDFGIARLIGVDTTKQGSSGTPPYMAPEQFSSGPVGPATDVFAWGSTVAYAASGRPPFGSDTFAAVAYRILHADPDLSEVPEPLRAIVFRSLTKDPAHRPAARDLLLELLGEHTPEHGHAPERRHANEREEATLRQGAAAAHTPGGPGVAVHHDGVNRDHQMPGRRPGGVSRRALLAAGGAVAATAATAGVVLWRRGQGSASPSSSPAPTTESSPTPVASGPTASPEASPPAPGDLATAVESAVGATPMADFSYEGGLSQGDWTFSAKGMLSYHHSAGSSPLDTRMDMTVTTDQGRVRQRVLLSGIDHFVDGKRVDDLEAFPIMEYAGYAHAMAAIGIIADLARVTPRVKSSGWRYSGALTTTKAPTQLWECFLRMPTVADTKEVLAKTTLTWQLDLDEQDRPTLFELAWHLLLDDGTRLTSRFTTEYGGWRMGEVKPGR
ncbi:serine/threonine-protein kinase [Nonomuraea sp. NPDC049152]|uniref:serine/threonine-protein kinase n=1 Tax=Nonomuraea sp. NPDC049152 TaxID=3154350 RepID=UPI0033EA0AF6